jgi:hypothetical protein
MSKMQTQTHSQTQSRSTDKKCGAERAYFDVNIVESDHHFSQVFRLITGHFGHGLTLPFGPHHITPTRNAAQNTTKWSTKHESAGVQIKQRRRLHTQLGRVWGLVVYSARNKPAAAQTEGLYFKYTGSCSIISTKN